MSDHLYENHRDDGFLNIADHDSYTDGVPHASFARLRAEDPVHWTTPTDGMRSFWSVTRQADILEANGKPEIFSSAQGIRIEDQSHEEYLARRTFQETDPPEHRVTRKLVNPAFSRPAIAQYEEMIRALAGDIVDAAFAKGSFDAVDMIAKQLPMMMLGRILGLPDSDLDWLVEKGDALIGNTDPDFTDHVVDKMDSDAYRLMPFRSPAGIDLYDYAETVFSGEKAVDPRGVLHRVIDADAGLALPDFKNFFCLLVAAGNDTTRYSIAMALYLLTRHPELLEQLQSGTVDDTAADEIIRLASPTMHFRRTATEDTMLGGQPIAKGDKVVLWFVSGNRDESVFADPHRPHLDRSPNPNVAFGQGGPHFCLGMWLARLEVKTVLQAMAARLASIEALEKPRWTRSNFICGVKSLPVRVQVR
ncbi:MAG: cytochrome P450 [Alphaproteobacteria bacterium]|nr:cytochrome P450 [Alphaproteobacteria bacterium]|tara:strand:- start:932 stop:2188 length:1257 start_codon:yes stop_codon:yes gene_type:complete